MIHFTYQLNNGGQTPKQQIKNVFGNVALELGKYPKMDASGNIEKIYGEIDIPNESVAQFQQIMADWQVEILTDQQALAFLDTLEPIPNAILQPRITSRAAVIINGKAEKVLETENV